MITRGESSEAFSSSCGTMLMAARGYNHGQVFHRCISNLLPMLLYVTLIKGRNSLNKNKCKPVKMEVELELFGKNW